MKKKKTYNITINGCDDYACIDFELTESEFQLVRKISVVSKQKSTYGCMPTISIDQAK